MQKNSTKYLPFCWGGSVLYRNYPGLDAKRSKYKWKYHMDYFVFIENLLNNILIETSL